MRHNEKRRMRREKERRRQKKRRSEEKKQRSQGVKVGPACSRRPSNAMSRPPF
ncbi:hypothetical protein BO86DRAFT_101232 [Aspergillus japonicus CBS 114.51]|uniref:Uncharacterized protein n=1 Tax=Aspergillus japonicus CBS 114.51 TaxID=1448312 RepID=A0A8T8X1H3_ASPJA|nr:hypothetical protein BO86DRAFT_101232 [Aspergillus japonicus CBS 114.51]RAH81399.1 hypothetical protein BO86DRAFT_101232 [Aspergillus japonicus CBS 114.51]